MPQTKADKILNIVLKKLDIENSSPGEKFKKIYQIFPELDKLNKTETFSVSTTGTITERICEWALMDALPSGYFRLTSNADKWLGDYCMLGTPFNIVISVKSYKVKERLLVSGSGSLLVPTVGWGFMDDPNEFKYERLKNYLYRGFIFDCLRNNNWICFRIFLIQLVCSISSSIKYHSSKFKFFTKLNFPDFICFTFWIYCLILSCI